MARAAMVAIGATTVMIDWIWDTDSDNDEESAYGFNEPTWLEGADDDEDDE